MHKREILQPLQNYLFDWLSYDVWSSSWNIAEMVLSVGEIITVSWDPTSVYITYHPEKPALRGLTAVSFIGWIHIPSSCKITCCHDYNSHCNHIYCFFVWLSWHKEKNFLADRWHVCVMWVWTNTSAFFSTFLLLIRHANRSRFELFVVRFVLFDVALSCVILFGSFRFLSTNEFVHKNSEFSTHIYISCDKRKCCSADWVQVL